MFFIWHQYLVLRGLILFGYKSASGVFPDFETLRVPFLGRKTIRRHCDMLFRTGCASRNYAPDGYHVTGIVPTEKGYDHFLSLHKALVESVVSFLASVLMLLLGVFIGKLWP